MNYAGVGVRFVATVIDAAILFPVFYGHAATQRAVG